MGVNLAGGAFGFEAAGAVATEFVAVGFDAHALHLGAEAEAAGDAVVEEGDVFVFELDDAVAVDADEVIVLGFVEEIGVVVGLFAAEVDVAEEAALDHEGEGAVNGGAGDGAVDAADAVEEFFGVEVLVRGEDGVDDDFALASAAQAFAGKVIVESFGDLSVH